MTSTPAATQAPPAVRVELLSNPLYLSGVRQMIDAIAQRLGFPPPVASQIALAVDEAICNVMQHGYCKRADGPIRLSIWSTVEGRADSEKPDGIRIVIEDEGQQVDPGQIKGRDLDDIRPGGLGVHIIHNIMDSVRYERREQSGMRLTLSKRRPPASNGDASK